MGFIIPMAAKALSPIFLKCPAKTVSTIEVNDSNTNEHIVGKENNTINSDMDFVS